MIRPALILVLVIAMLSVGAASAAKREALPGGIREVDVRRAPDVSRRVTDPAKVARIVRWFDALPLAPRGVYYCPMIQEPRPTRFNFRAGDGTLLAHATTPGAAACGGSFNLEIGGHLKKPLRVGHVLVRVERLLGVRLLG